MLRALAVLTFVPMLSCVVLAPARSEALLQEIVAKPLFQGGRVSGCSLEYAATFRDNTYRKGAISGVSGSFTLFRPQEGRGPFAMFKLIAVDFDSAGKMLQFRPALAQVLTDSAVVAGGQAVECENHLSRCSVHSSPEWFKVAERIMKKGRLTVSYSRSLSGFSVLVDISAEATALEDLLLCTKQLAQ